MYMTQEMYKYIIKYMFPDKASNEALVTAQKIVRKPKHDFATKKVYLADVEETKIIIC